MDYSKYKNNLKWTKNPIDRTKYNNEDVRIYNLFKKDALEEVGITNHKNAEKIFSYAYRENHSEGYEAIFQNLQELADLLN